MKFRRRFWTLMAVPLMCFVLMGGSCDSDTGGVLGIISAVIQLVLSIIDIAG